MTSSSRAAHHYRQGEILEAAFAIVREGGLSNLTMKKIADRISLTEAAIYRYFPTKDNLILVMHEHFRQMFIGMVNQITSREDLSPAQRVAAIWRRLVAMNDSQDGFALRLIAETIAAADAKHLDRLKDFQTEFLERLENSVSQVTPMDCPVQSRDLVMLMLGLPAALAIWGHVLDDAQIAMRVQDELIPFVLQCLTGMTETEVTATIS